MYREVGNRMLFITRLVSFTATLALGAATASAQSAPPSPPPAAAQPAQPGAPAQPVAAAPVQPAAVAVAPTHPAPAGPGQPPAAAPPQAATAQPAAGAAYYPAYQPYPASPAHEPPPPPAPRPRQKNDVLIVAYNTSVGLGDTHDFAPDFSFLGFSFDWRARVSDKFWPGVTVGWQVLYGKDEKTLHYGNTTFTGTIATNLNLIPMLITGNYYFMTDPRGVRPFGGFGVGAYAAEHRLDVGIWTVSDTSWHFGFAPELGVVLPAGFRQLVVSTKFNYAAASGRWDPLMYLNFNVGVEL